MLYAATTFKYSFDHQPDTDVYWCTADIGWITGWYWDLNSQAYKGRGYVRTQVQVPTLLNKKSQRKCRNMKVVVDFWEAGKNGKQKYFYT